MEEGGVAFSETVGENTAVPTRAEVRAQGYLARHERAYAQELVG